MARTSVDMENHTCDDRKCGITKAAPAGDRRAPAGWIVGVAAQADAEGNVPVSAEWVPFEACKETHVRKAVEGALEREGVTDDPAPAESAPAESGPSEALENGATRDVSAITARA